MGRQYNILDDNVKNNLQIRYDDECRRYVDYTMPVTAIVPKEYGLDGLETQRPAPMSLPGGYGSGLIPDFARETIKKAKFEPTRLYGVTEIDRMTAKVSTKKRSYVAGFEPHMKKGAQGYALNLERMIVGNPAGNGALGKISALYQDQGSGRFVLTITDDSWVLACWEPNVIMNIGSASTSKFILETVDATNKRVTVKRTEGDKVPAANDVVFVQNSEGKDVYSLLWASDNTGTKYGIDIGFRWNSVEVDAGGAAIEADMIDECITKMWENYGIYPTDVLLPSQQLRKLRSNEEHKKTLGLGPAKVPSSGPLAAKVGHTGVQILTEDGEIAATKCRHLHASTIMFVYRPDIVLAYVGDGPSWVDETGAMWRELQRPYDGFYAVFAGYAQTFIPPPCVAKIKNLAV